MMCKTAWFCWSGVFAGIVMGIEQDFQLAPAHANPN